MHDLNFKNSIDDSSFCLIFYRYQKSNPLDSAGMSLEDAAVLGELLSQYPKSSSTLSATSNLKSSFLQHTLPIYQALRAPRTQIVVERGNTQQYLYHLSDGPEQIERDRKMREQEDGEALAWRDKGFAPWLLGYRVSDEVSGFEFDFISVRIMV